MPTWNCAWAPTAWWPRARWARTGARLAKRLDTLEGKVVAERNVVDDALDQVALADRLGFDYAWEVEHHFLDEYSHSSAPEVFLAAAAARTKRIRLGHGIVQLPQEFNHTARVAERVEQVDGGDVVLPCPGRAGGSRPGARVERMTRSALGHSQVT